MSTPGIAREDPAGAGQAVYYADFHRPDRAAGNTRHLPSASLLDDLPTTTKTAAAFKTLIQCTQRAPRCANGACLAPTARYESHVWRKAFAKRPAPLSEYVFYPRKPLRDSGMDPRLRALPLVDTGNVPKLPGHRITVKQAS